MLLFEKKRAGVILGSGDILITPCQDTEGRCYVMLEQHERGPITPINEVIDWERDYPNGVPENAMFIESTKAESLDILIMALAETKRGIRGEPVRKDMYNDGMSYELTPVEKHIDTKRRV